MNKLKRLIAVVIVACTALSFTACSDTTWAYRTGDKEINSGLYIMQSINAYFMAQSHKDIDENVKDLFKQKLDGKTAKQWIIDETRRIADEYLAFELKFDELGLTLTETDKNIIEQDLKENWPLVSKEFMENGVGEETYKKSLANTRKRDLIFAKYYEKGGIEEVSDADLMTHFEENFASINMFSVSLETGEDLTDEQIELNEQAEEDAKDMLAKLNKGDKSFNEVYSDYKKELNKDLPEEEQVDTTAKPDEETRFVVEKTSKNPSEDVVKAIFEEVKVDGEVKLLEDEKGYYLVKRYDVKKDTKNFDEMRKKLLSKIKGEDFLNMVKKWTEETSPKVTSNDAAIRRYDPKNIDIAF